MFVAPGFEARDCGLDLLEEASLVLALPFFLSFLVLPVGCETEPDYCLDLLLEESFFLLPPSFLSVPLPVVGCEAELDRGLDLLDEALFLLLPSIVSMNDKSKKKWYNNSCARRMGAQTGKGNQQPRRARSRRWGWLVVSFAGRDEVANVAH